MISFKNCISMLLVLVITSSCIGFKDLSKQKSKESISFRDNSTLTERTKQDYIIFPAPRTPKDRPKDTTIIAKGKNGLTSVTNYDKDGFLSGQIISSPVTEKTELRDVEGEYLLKTLDLERKLNVDTINAIGKWTAITFIPIGFFFALAFWLRSN